MPHPDLMQSPDLQTDGRFDPEKYQRFLASPMARQGGLLQNLESYYRSELPRQKLFEQVAADVYVTDARMWQVWQDVHDSVQVTYVALAPALVPDAEVSVSDGELRQFFDNNRSMFERNGLAVVSVVEIPRAVTAADSAATLARVQALREEITSGQSTFEDVARRESMDQASAIEGGLLPPSTRGSFVPEFENAAYALAPRQVSQPVLSQFGYHLLRVDARAGDTLTIRHILIPVTQTEENATAADRQADRLAAIAGGMTEPERFDEAVSELNLAPVRATAIQGQPLAIGGQFIPSVSAWAFSGAVVGETSELFEGEVGYYMARLDSLVPAGDPRFDDVREEVRARVVENRKLDQLESRAQELARAAVAGSLESAAAAQNLTPATTGMFSRISFVPGLGQGNKAIGAPFALAANAISAPVRTEDAIYVMRVDRRINADRTAWDAQRDTQRTLLTQSLQQERVQAFLQDLRESARIVDRRHEINAATRTAGL
jgi:peptidyl-prolyl cis-trans isomerase D